MFAVIVREVVPVNVNRENIISFSHTIAYYCLAKTFDTVDEVRNEIATNHNCEDSLIVEVKGRSSHGPRMGN